MRAFTRQQKSSRPQSYRVERPCAAADDAARGTRTTPLTELTRFAHDLSRVPVSEKISPRVQAKGPTADSNADAYEREADRVSESVTRAAAMPSHAAERPGGESHALRMARIGPSDAPLSAAPHAAREVLNSHGRGLDPSARAQFEPRFGRDFSDVRVHTDARAAESAKALGALAYTFGNHIVFDSGRYAPASPEGRRLLAHELTHVVQQGGGQTSQGARDSGRAESEVISRAPAGLLSRQPKPSAADDARKKDEAQRLDRIKFHVEQQKKVAAYLDNARKLTPDAKRGIRDPDNLVHNSVQMLDGGKLTLTVMTPTHYEPKFVFDSRFKFDSKGAFPKIGGEYPPDRKGGVGMEVQENVNVGGQVKIPTPPTPPIKLDTTTRPEEPTRERVDPTKPIPPKPAPTTTAPAPTKPAPTTPTPTTTAPAPSAPFSPGDVILYTQGLTVGEEDFRQTFVHEVQHVADLSPKTPNMTNWSDVLESYKSEFRAHWIQPQRPPAAGGVGRPAIDMLPDPSVKPDNTTPVTVKNPAGCNLCPPPPPGAKGAAAFSEPKTAMKNARQEQIFQHLLSKYPQAGYDCCYVFNRQFHNEVNRFAQPEGLNVINSDRLMNLNLELRKLTTATTKDDIAKTNVVSHVQALDALDWAFLNDRKVSAPFWDALKKGAPKFLADFVKRLAKMAAKRPLSPADIAGELWKTPSPKP
ncbi:MAG TPA: DUF4157 domain-containing protein [Pyrinomonadaceae bacterium]|jgi:hypothetical protein|nr:DUF4157 domain-containing protein [Pyrinomonadaceae bacterium]